MCNNDINVEQALNLMSVVVNVIKSIMSVNQFREPRNVHREDYRFRYEQERPYPYFDSRGIYSIQNGVFDRPSHVPHQDLNSFQERIPQTNNPHFDSQLSVATDRDRRHWNSQPYPDSYPHRSVKYRRRKSHLDDIYGPNYEDFNEPDYNNRERYSRWDQHRGQTLRSIRRVPLNTFVPGNRANIHPRNIASSACSAVNAVDKKRSVESTVSRNKEDYKKGCETETKTSKTIDAIEINKSPNEKTLGDKKCDSDTNDFSTSKSTSSIETFSAKNDKKPSILEEKVTRSSPVPALIVQSNSSTVPKIEKHDEVSFDKSNQMNEKSSNVPTETQPSAENLNQLNHTQREPESNEEITSYDFLTVDNIDTTKSFLKTSSSNCMEIDMDIDCSSPSPVANSNSVSQSSETKSKKSCPELDSDPLLDELSRVINGNCDGIAKNVVRDKRQSDFEEGPLDNCNSSTTKKAKDNHRTDERAEFKNKHSLKVKESKSITNKPEHGENKKTEKPCAEKMESSKKVKSCMDSSEKRKMSSLYFPGLANYTIPKKGEKRKFSDTDEPYMDKMKSLFGCDDDDDDEELTNTKNLKKSDLKDSFKKRSNTAEGQSRNRFRETSKNSSASQDSKTVEGQRKSSKHSQEKCKRHKPSMHKSTAAKTDNAKKDRRKDENLNKISQKDNNPTENKSFPKSDIQLEKNPKTTVTRKLSSDVESNTNQVTETNNTKQLFDINKGKLKISDKRRHSTTASSSTKSLITERRHSIQAGDSHESRNDRLLEKMHLKKISDKISKERSEEVLLKEMAEKANVQVKLVRITTTKSISSNEEEISGEQNLTVERANDEQNLQGDETLTEKNNTSVASFNEVSRNMAKIFEEESSTKESEIFAEEMSTNTKSLEAIISREDMSNIVKDSIVGKKTSEENPPHRHSDLSNPSEPKGDLQEEVNTGKNLTSLILNPKEQSVIYETSKENVNTEPSLDDSSDTTTKTDTRDIRTSPEQPTEHKSVDASDDSGQKVKPESEEDDKTLLASLKFQLLVKTAVKCELTLMMEKCCNLDGFTSPACQRVFCYSTVNECCEEVSVMEMPEVERNVEVIKTLIDDDVIEIKSNIPLIDLTNESPEAASTENTEPDVDLLGLLKEEYGKSEKITIYRSEETSSNTIDVQAMSASLLPSAVLGPKVTNSLEADFQESSPRIPKDEVLAQSDLGLNQETATTSANSGPGSENCAIASGSKQHFEQSHTLSNSAQSEHRTTVAVPQTAADIISSSTSTKDIPSTMESSKTVSENNVSNSSACFLLPPSTRDVQQNSSNTSDRIQTSSLLATNLGQEKLATGTIPPSSHQQTLHRFTAENRFNRVDMMQDPRNDQINISRPELTSMRMNVPNTELISGNYSTSNNVLQNTYRSDNNKNSKTPVGEEQIRNNIQQQYLSNVLAPYIHFVSYIRNNLTHYVAGLKEDQYFLPGLVNIEMKLSQYIYKNKVQIYSSYIVKLLKSLNLSGNMSVATAHATLDLIYQNIKIMNSNFTKTSVVLYLDLLMDPHKQFYLANQYLNRFYHHVKFLAMEILRRGQNQPSTTTDTSSAGNGQLFLPEQRKILEYQIQQYQKILMNTERSRLRSAAVSNQPNSSASPRSDSTLTLQNLLQSSPMVQRAVNNNQELIRNGRTETSRQSNRSRPYQRSSESSSQSCKSAANQSLPSPAHKPKGFNITPNSSSISQIENMVKTMAPGYRINLLANPKSTAHTSEGFFTSPAHPSIPMHNDAFMQFAQSSVSMRSPAHTSVIVQNATSYQNHPNNVGCNSASRTPAHRSESIADVSAHFNMRNRNPTSTLAYRSPAHVAPAGFKITPTYFASATPNPTNTMISNTAATRSPAHRPDVLMRSPAHRSDVLMRSPAHKSDGLMNSPAHLSSAGKVPPESRPTFLVPKHPPPRSGGTNSSSSVHMSPILVEQNSPLPTLSSMSPARTFTINVNHSPNVNPSRVDYNSSTELPASDEASRTPGQTNTSNLTVVKSPVYAPMLFSPQSYIQDEPEVVDETITEESVASDESIETIDLTWLDEVDEEEIQKEIELIVVKKEEPDDDEVILNQEQFPMALSPTDSGIASPVQQEECNELVYSDRLCICERPAEYLCMCRLVMYCSVNCQTMDWKEHKSICLKQVVKSKDNN